MPLPISLLADKRLFGAKRVDPTCIGTMQKNRFAVQCQCSGSCIILTVTSLPTFSTRTTLPPKAQPNGQKDALLFPVDVALNQSSENGSQDNRSSFLGDNHQNIHIEDLPGLL